MIHKYFIWSLKALLFLLLILLLLLAVVYFGLRSSLVEKQLLPSLKPFIKEKSGFNLEVGGFRFDLFGDLKVTDLSLQKIDEKQKLDLRFNSLELYYDLTKLFKGCISVEKLTISGLKVNGDLILEKASPNKPQESRQDSEFSIQDLLNLFNEPPIAVEIQNLKIEPVTLDVQFSNSTQNVKYQGIFSSEGSLQWCNSDLHGKILLETFDTLLELEQQGDKATKLLTHPSLKSDVEWEVKSDKESLILQIKPTTLLFNTNQTTFISSETNQEIQLSLQDYNLTVLLEGVVDLLEPQGSSFEWNVRQSLIHFNLNAELNNTKIKLDTIDFDLALQGNSSKEINTTLQNHTHFNLKANRVNIVKNNDTKNNISVTLTPNYSLSSYVKVNLANNNTSDTIDFELSSAEVFQKFDVSKFEMHTDTHTTRFKKQTWELNATLENNNARVESDLYISQLESPLLLQPLSLNHKLSYTSDLDLKQALLKTSIDLDTLNASVFDLSLAVENASQSLTLTPDLKLSLPQTLQQWSKQFKILDKTGDIEFKMHSKIQIEHFANSMQDANWTAFNTMPFRGDVDLWLQQNSKPSSGELELDGPVDVQLMLSRVKPEHYKSNLGLKTKGIYYPPLKKPLPLELLVNTNFDESLHKIDSNAYVNINHQPLMKYAISINNQTKNLELQSDWNLYADLEWRAFLTQLQALEKTGSLHLESTLDLNLSHPFESIAKFNPKALNSLKTQVQLNGSLEQHSKHENSLITLKKPLSYEHTLHWQEAASSANATYYIEEFSFSNKLHIENIMLSIHAKPNHGLRPNAIEVTLNSSGEEIEFFLDKNTTIEVGSLVLPLSLALKADFNETTQYANLDRFQLSLGGGLLEQSLHGFTSLDGSNGMATGETKFALRENLLKAPLPPLSGSGNLSIPWRITLADSKQLSVKSDIIFDKLSVTTDKLAISDMQGKMSIDQELELDQNSSVSFGYIISADPFQRVDFDRVEPYLNDQNSFNIKSLQFGKTTIGPMQAKIPIKQNMMRLQQFNLKLLGGHVAGQVYLNIAPEALSFGLLSRITQVDLRKLLLDSENLEASPVSARTALEFDFSKRLLQGRIDITDITQNQLLQLLELLDPNHKDIQLNQVRNALRYAHPKRVAMDMDRGLLNLSISLSLLNKPIVVRGLPLTPLIERYAGKILNQISNSYLSKKKDMNMEK